MPSKIELPTSPIPATTQDPKYLILFGLPKVGKTTILSTLPNNLILDTEGGSNYVNALKVQVTNLTELREVCQAIIAKKCPYKYITIDTITAVEDMTKPLAIQLYKQSPMFSERYASTTDPVALPNGCGWSFWRQAVEMVVDMVSRCAPNLIICGHVKDSKLNDESGNVLKDLDLTGKIKRVLSAKSDAIGYVTRSEKGDLCIQFGSDGEVLTGARPAHLANKTIVVAERRPDGSFISHWDRIYPSEAQ